ncbi:MAG: hypothetical protein M1827_005042 [Pycnora praestabilis]|nr:MAG: hypothetical protein M1827_005042 [Pycnora praestabilis]
MAAGSLTSNHVNYLIWRYLQESGHGEAAIKLQCDWNRDPQSLAFAPHIKTHALVSLVQKGLQYYEIERTIDQARAQQLNGDRLLPSPSTYFFGPDSDKPNASRHADADEDGAYGAPRTTSKNPRESRPTNGVLIDISSPAEPKKSQRSNGIESNGDTMDVDAKSNGHSQPPSQSIHPSEASLAAAAAAAAPPSSPSPTKAELSAAAAPSPVAPVAVEDQEREGETTMTLTNGHSVGVQSDKVAELGGPATTYLCLGDTANANASASASRHTNNSRSVQLMHIAWNPRDPAILAASGDALSRIWNVARPNAVHSAGGYGNTNGDTCINGNTNGNRLVNGDQHNYKDLLQSVSESCVTASSWSPDGQLLAIATRQQRNDWDGEVSLWSAQGDIVHGLSATQDMLLALRWNPSGSLLLGLAFAGEGGGILVWSVLTGQLVAECISNETVVDAVWMTDTDFICCGNGMLKKGRVDYSANQASIIFWHQWETKVNWQYVRFDSLFDTIAVASDGDIHDGGWLGVVDESMNLNTQLAHDDQITALEFQPVPNRSAYTTSAPPLLATASFSGTVCLWAAKRPSLQILHRLIIGPSIPVMALSFTPDGFLIAAAGHGKVMVWNAEKGGLPLAGWNDQLGRSASDGIEEEEEEVEEVEEDDEANGNVYGLSWDADGGKLAFGYGSQVRIVPNLVVPEIYLHLKKIAIINFRR